MVKVLISLLVVAYAIFPVVYVFSSAINPVNSLVGATLIPRNATLANFQSLFDDPQHPFPKWIFNSIVVSGISAALIVALTAVAGYSFSRFRYKGRRAGLLALVLVQLFPNSLAIVALFLLLRPSVTSSRCSASTRSAASSWSARGGAFRAATRGS